MERSVAGVEPGARGEVTEDIGVGVCAAAAVERGVGREGALGRGVEVGVAIVGARGTLMRMMLSAILGRATF